VPDVLTSGHHARVERWRRDEALRRTASRRPDLLAALDPATLDARDVALLAELGWAVEPDGVRPAVTTPAGTTPASTTPAVTTAAGTTAAKATAPDPT
jgi:tRNA (guanine37-N1)-methyltransferase